MKNRNKKTKDNSFVDMDEQPLSNSQKKTMDVLNQEKKQVLKKYNHMLVGFDLEKIKVLPMLIPRKEVMRMIEMIHDKQVTEIVQQKSKYAIYLPAIIRKMLKDKYRTSRQSYIQNICNFVYSVHNYAQYPELKLFLKFMRDKRENYQLLFYLYLRQHCKILLNLNFMQLHKSNKNPLDIKMTKKQGSDIIRYGFYYDEIIQGKIMKKFQEIFKGKEKIIFYDYLTQLSNLEINLKDLNLMENLIALFRIKNERDLLRIRFSEYASKYSDYSEVRQEYEERMNQITQNMSIQDDEESEMNADGTQTKSRTNAKPRSIVPNIQVPQMLIGNPLDRKNLIDLQPEKVYSAMKKKLKRKVSKADLNLHKGILQELDNYCEKIIKSYIQQQQIALSEIMDTKLIVKQRILKKLLCVCLSLFFNQRRTFFHLLRKEVGKDHDTLEFWDSLNSTYDQLKEFEIFDRTVFKTFLHKLFENDQISDQIMQQLKFSFKNDYDLVNYQVDFEFKNEGLEEKEDSMFYENYQLY